MNHHGYAAAAYASARDDGSRASSSGPRHGHTQHVDSAAMHRPVTPFPGTPAVPMHHVHAAADPQSPSAAPRPQAPAAVELVWHDMSFAAALKDHAAFQRYLARPEPEGVDRSLRKRLRANADPGQAKQSDARRDAVAIVSAAPASRDDLTRLVMQSRDADGALRPPALVVEGELVVSFDEQAELEMALGAAKPLAAAHEGLRRAVEAVEQAAKSPLGQLPATARELTDQLGAAWSEATRRPRGDLRDRIARLLTRERRYAMRELLDGEFIRAEIRGEDGIRVVYLDAAARRRLPLFRAFPARLVVEAVPRQDEDETAPVALRARVVARMISDSTA